MAKLKVQKAPKKEVSSEDTFARFCYYFPKYSYAQARRLPYARVVKMLRVAYKERASMLAELTQIAAAPHTKNGKGVRDLLSKYESIVKG